MTFVRTILLATLLIVPAYNQTKGDKPVHLTMPKVNATLTAFTNFGELLASDPELRKQSKEIEKSLPDTDDDNNKFAVGLNKLSEKDSRVASIFSKAGVSSREAASTLQMLMASAVAESMLQPGQAIPKDMDPALAGNLKFYREHKGELAPSLQRFQALNDKVNGPSDK